MELSIGDIAIPGDKIKDFQLTNSKQKIILGPGLRTDGDVVYACKAGIVKQKASVFYIDSFQKRYVPSQGENVVGIVIQKAGDIFKVDIGSNEPASLSYIAFEGASKKNRPNVQIGDIVYAKLLLASKDMESELVCVDSFGKKGKLGLLSSNGMLFTTSLSLVRKILKPDCPLLHLLSERLKYELAVGMNGKIWIKSKASIEDTIAVANTILAAEYTPPSEYQVLCNNILKSLSKLK